MSLFKRQNKADSNRAGDKSALAEIALNAIHDGVIMTDKKGNIQFVNPAAARIIGSSMHHAVGLDYGLVIKLESKEGRELSEQENPLVQAMNTGQPLEPTQVSLIVPQSNQRIPIAISMQVANDTSANRIITFRDITKELAEEGEQAEFISTASHEMRTPVATIDGYLSLCLNPQTATIDERALGYLTAAQKASKHLGKLFQDLLDVTKLDDGHIKPHFVPAEMIELVKTISDDYAVQAKEAKLTYNFGSSEPVSFGIGSKRMSQVVYGFVDVDFMREIVGNLITNAIKYTPAGGSIYVNVRGDGDRVLINVTDTGMGISAEDLGHIFQKFYRVDNSDTRTIGGTGLGLYIVKQRVEAMGGKVWAESAFGEGSTFYVSLPRLTNDEYEKRMITVRNQQMMTQTEAALTTPVATAPITPTTPTMPASTSSTTPATTTPPITTPVATTPATPSPVTASPMIQPTIAPTPAPASITSTPVPPSTAVPVQPVTAPVMPSSPTTTTAPTPIPPPVATSPPVSTPQATLNPIQPVQTLNNNNLNGEIK